MRIGFVVVKIGGGVVDGVDAGGVGLDIDVGAGVVGANRLLLEKKVDGSNGGDHSIALSDVDPGELFGVGIALNGSAAQLESSDVVHIVVDVAYGQVVVVAAEAGKGDL